MKEQFKKTDENESEQGLISWLDHRINRNGEIDIENYSFIEKALLGTWHSQHEDLVNLIFLAKFIVRSL